MATKELIRQTIAQLDENEQEEVLNFIHYLLWRQHQAGPAKDKRYDFSDLAGKLTWPGDAMAEQRAIRDEW
jgi:hypothetical protein